MEEYTLLPADTYIVINKTILTEYDKNILLSLYAPIIGGTAISVYLSFWSDLDKLNLVSEYYTHHKIMNFLKIALKDFREAKDSLEAYGLLKTFYKEGSVNNFIYELYSPLDAKEFFSHPVLGVLFYNSVGKTEYEKSRLLFEEFSYNLKDYKDVTKKINDVFNSVSLSTENIRSRTSGKINVDDVIDFDEITSAIPKEMMSSKVFTKKTKDLINLLAFTYNINTFKMTEIIRTVLNSYGMINKEKLKEEIKNHYEFKTNSLPSLVYRSQPEYLKSANNPESKREKIINIFESITPYDFLKTKNRGITPSFRDLKIIESLLVEVKLTPAVVNVLIDYVLRKNNNKLIKTYIETIAHQWKRANLKTAEEAMDFAEREHNKQKPKTKSKIEKTKEPVWFSKTIEKEEISKEEEEELKNMLKEFN